ncbi:MAG: hypothetical protein HYZ74_01640 [Elusimicrobia bacterium]|nr:hypothetical protein [Elusimicrobiota bacterium]
MAGEVPGSYEPEALAALPGFGMTTLVCPAQGEIAEKNWRRAGEFDDIVRAIDARQSQLPPPAPLGAPPSPNEVDSLLDTASTRLFSHVADLMKELESRREEKSLIVSLQRQISALKQELTRTTENATMLEIRIPRIAELEEAQRKDHSAMSQLQTSLAARDLQVNELRVAHEKLRSEYEATKQNLQETAANLAIRNRLIDKLSHDLSEKELSLAKSLGVIRRMEEDLDRLCPSEPRASAPVAAVAPAPIQPSTPPPAPLDVQPVAAQPAPAGPATEPLKPELASAPAPKAAAPAPATTSGFTDDDPPPPPPYLEPQVDSPKAHEALVSFFRKVFPGQPH